MAYAAALLGDAANEVEAIDEAMRLGYNWKFGPFELMDQLGTDWLAERLEKDGHEVPLGLRMARGRPFYRALEGRRQVLGLDGHYRDIARPEGVLMLEDIKLTATPLLKNGSAALWDIGDGVACFEFTSKMNSLDIDTTDLLKKSILRVQQDFKALVIYSEGSNFSAGANLGLPMFFANIADWSKIEKLVSIGQETYRALKYAPFPVVSAPSGMARRRLRNSPEGRCRPGPCRNLCRPGGSGRRPDPRLGRLQGDATPLGDPGPVAPWSHARRGQGVRADQHRHRGEIGGRGQGDAPPAPRRRHHDEPLSPAGRRQGQGAGPSRELYGARAAHLCPARPVGQDNADHGRRRLPSSG